jgi:ATP-dependent exoDNAse (exonuclease V) beta subunit
LPKNAHVRSATTILRDIGLPVFAGGYTDLFSSADAQILRMVLRIVNNPYDGASLADYILSPYSGIPILEAHTLLHTLDTRKLSLDMLRNYAKSAVDLFTPTNPLSQLVERLSDWALYNQSHSVYETLQYMGEELLLRDVEDHQILVSRAEIIRTCLHIALVRVERDPHLTLTEYLAYFDRLAEYGEHIPVALFGLGEGVRVMTMHASKGLEFDHVWILHMDEKSLTSGKRNAFVLPESIEMNLLCAGKCMLRSPVRDALVPFRMLQRVIQEEISSLLTSLQIFLIIF